MISLQNVEATLYATLMSVQNGANGVGGLQGALFTMIFGVTSTTFTGPPPRQAFDAANKSLL